MAAKFGLFLGEDPIPVINWVNRHGSPEGKDLRFTLPTDAKAKIEANMKETFTLKRGDDAWEITFVSLAHHGTGTNGIRAIGRVAGASKPAPKKKKPKASASIPEPSEISEAVEASAAEKKGSDFEEKPKTLAEKLKEKLAQKRSERESEATDDTSDSEE